MAAGDPGVLKRNFSATAIQTSLVNSISSAATGDTTTSVAVISVSGFPSTVPYTLILDPDGSKEEVVTVTAASSTTLTITRGQDNTPAVAHSAGTSVRHGVSGRDFKEEQTHIAARGYDVDSGILSNAGQTHVHGLQTGDGSVVGADQVATLTRKTLTTPVINGATLTGTVSSTASIVVSGAGTITGLSSAGMSASSAAPKSYVDAILVLQLASAASSATSASMAATSATSAATSATASASSAATATTQAGNAATSATAAATSATSASASATAAATSASSAATSAASAAASTSAAAVSATAAATSAASAATSATAAATSATSAAATATTQASNAATSASSALTSQTAAATSATSAAASATAAATSATSAAASATAAATSATSAAASATAAAGYVVPSQTGNAGKALVTDGSAVSWSSTINGTAIPATKTLVVTTDKLSALAATTSAELRGVISDETGTGALVFANTPTLVTPALGAATGTSLALTSTATVGGSTPNAGTALTANAQVFLNSNVNWNYGNLEITRNAANTATPRFIGMNLDGDSKTDTTIGATNSIWGIYDSAPTTGSLSSTLNSVMGYGAYAGHRWYTNGTERMRIVSTGLVGIGATPSDAMFTVVNNTIGNIGAIIRGASGQTAGLLEVQNNAATALVKVDSAGNVGIGTTTPASYGLLSVATTAAGTPKTITLLNSRTFTANDGRGVMLAALSSNGTVGEHDYGSIAFGGNANIGPAGGGATVQFYAGGPSSIKTLSAKYLETNANGGVLDLSLWTQGSSRLHINSDGNVGIGTTTPTAKLDVNGSIKSDNLSSVNAVLNSGMNVWQRGTSIGATNQSAYTADRWMVSTAASMSVTVSRQATSDTTNLPNIQYCMRVQRNNGQTATGNWNMQQSMESINSIPFAGKTVTLSFYARKGANFSAASDLMSVGFYSGTGTDQNFQTGYTGTTNIVNTTQALTTTWVRYTFTGSVPSTATEMALVLGYTATGTAGASDFFEITGVQVEIGSVATPYRSNQSTFAQEFIACKRYYQQSTPYGVLPTSNQSGFPNILQNVPWYQHIGKTDGWSLVFPFEVEFRTAPAMAFYFPDGTSGHGTVQYGAGSSSTNNNAGTYMTSKYVGKNVSVYTSGGIQTLNVQWSGSAEL
jgi:hypothetical protein